ncbi:hypothetical protein [Nonomuraea sp. NPDC049141]|uniref:hypothetical protein n=1 Tax=Nonomuraea sp. NPDC049141 TaxID=3155500 RepID=UPI0033DD3552
MTGPEHYRKAEELLADAEDPNRVANHEDRLKLILAAQAHATLAHAAATALLAPLSIEADYSDDDYMAWGKVAGVGQA